MRAPIVFVGLTRPQLDALISLCGYAEAGGPEDVGMPSGMFRTLARADQVLRNARDADDAARKP